MPVEGVSPGSRVDYALRYAKAGFRVLPLNWIKDGACSCGDSDCRSAGKHPLVIPDKGMTGGVHSASGDPALLRVVFEQHPNANIGIAIPDDMLAIDIDPRNGGDVTIDLLQGQYGPLPDTVQQITGGGGLHYLFRKPAGLKVAGKLGAGIDVKSAGGYILAEPSEHVSGRAYVWEASSDPLDGVQPVDAPAWIMNKLAAGEATQGANTGLRYGVDEKVIAELRSALGYLNTSRQELADDRDMWVRVGMACKSIGDAGYQLWEEWSMASAKFDAEDQFKKWQSFNPTSISYRTVFLLAQQEGWHNPMAKRVEAAIVAEKQHTEAPKTGFKFKKASELASNIKPTEWLIKNYVETNSLAVLFGPPANGKSLLAIDFACCVATGKEWQGNRIEQSPVFYIAGEGDNGIGRRLRAWEQENATSLEGMPMYVSAAATEVVNDAAIASVQEAVIALCEQAQAAPGLIIVDTVARNFGAEGDENSTKDMSKFITNLDNYFKHAFRCCVMVVHHSGWVQGRQRGSSALKAGADCEYEVTKTEEGAVLVKCHKMKDAQEPTELLMRIHQVELDGVIDEDGEPVTSVVLRQAEIGSVGDVIGKDRDGKEIRASDLLKLLYRGWVPYSEIEKSFKCARATAQRMVKKCVESELLRPVSGSGKGEHELTDKGREILSQTGAFLGARKPVSSRPWMDTDDE